MQYTVISPILKDGKRYSAGQVLELSEVEAAALASSLKEVEPEIVEPDFEQVSDLESVGEPDEPPTPRKSRKKVETDEAI